jgi:imidazolonepropionase-like amidohydrolase
VEGAIRTWADANHKRMDRARKAGVRVVMASDMWFRYPGKDRGHATLLVLAGLQAEGVPPAEILKAATLNAADLLGWSDRVGAVEAGRLADLVALDGDPLSDVKELQKIAFVMKGGVVVVRRADR